MDNLTHSLAGWVLAETGLKRRTRKGLAAMVLGANMPDIDVFFGWAGWAPLAMHRGFTHGLVGGVLLMPPLLAGLLWLFDRWQVGRGTHFRSGLPMHVGWLVGLAYLGAITHPLLDLQNVYAVQLLSPLSDTWFHTDALFIVDLWMWLMMAAGIWFARKAERNGASRPGVPAVIATIAVIAYIAMNAVISMWARRAPSIDEPYAAPDAIFAAPPPLAFWRRDVVWRQDGVISRGSYNLLARPFTLAARGRSTPDGMADPRVRRAIGANPEILDFMRWSVLPTARVEQQGCKAVVQFGDARFEQALTATAFRHVAVVDTCAPASAD